MIQYGFYFDSSRCTGCKTCEMACKDYNDLDASITFRRVYDYEGGGWSLNGNGSWSQTAFVYHLSLSCNHCGNPVCVQVCPTGAMHRDEGTGLVQVDNGVCVGCGYCELSCPYGAPHVSMSSHQSAKCHGCSSRVAAGKDPICVRSCPMRALDFGDVAELRKRPGVVSAIAPMPDPSHTSPRIFVKPCPAAREVGSDEGWIANPLEV